jgi:teichuronic acid biosynthesis glycosyltransferase TuaC
VGRELRIVSVCRSLPTPDDPSSGVFVLNRLAAMRAQADVQVIQQIPFFPGVKPRPDWARAPGRRIGELPIAHAPMFYTPGVLKSLDSYWLERAIGPAIRQLHRERALDAIDAHFGYPEGVSCVRIAQRLGLPVFITIRGFEAEYVLKKGIGGQLVAALRAATGCISVSHSLCKLALECGVPSERVRVVHNAIDSQVFNWGEPQAARARLAFPAQRRLIVSVGHLISRKRHHVLLDAFAQVRRAAPDVELAIIGGSAFERAYPDELVARARSLGVLESTRFLGNLAPAAVADWLRAADVFALATAREGCCNAVLEALAAGVPVVTTDVGDNAFFVRNDANGAIVPVDDADALARGIERSLLAQQWDRRRISRDLLAEVGSWGGVAARALDFMRERIGQARGPATAAAA